MMAAYKQLRGLDGNVTSAAILRTADSANIPNDSGNRDWIAYQTWLGLGNTPDAA